MSDFWKDYEPEPTRPAPVQQPFGYFKAEPFGWTDCAETDEGAVALYEHPAAQPVQDKVTLIQTNVGIGERAMEAYEASKERDRAARSAPTVQEPVCQKCGGTGEVEEGGVYPSGDLAYVPCECATQPAAQRQWVGLTQTEVDECYESVMFNPDIEPTRVLVYQAIEAKLKERNV